MSNFSLLATIRCCPNPHLPTDGILAHFGASAYQICTRVGRVNIPDASSVRSLRSSTCDALSPTILAVFLATDPCLAQAPCTLLVWLAGTVPKRGTGFHHGLAQMDEKTNLIFIHDTQKREPKSFLTQTQSGRLSLDKTTIM
jgi:hypothetical protein